MNNDKLSMLRSYHLINYILRNEILKSTLPVNVLFLIANFRNIIKTKTPRVTNEG